LVTQERLKELFYYHPDSGDFVRLVMTSSNARAGYQVGCPDKDGYLVFRVDGVLYKAHRLAWLYMHGVWPPHGIDHEDKITNHNWISNLRVANQSQNLCNTGLRKDNSSGHKDIKWRPSRGKFTVEIQYNKKSKYVGIYSRLEDAIIARDATIAEMHGAFARTA
jgi:HNH endonuclease